MVRTKRSGPSLQALLLLVALSATSLGNLVGSTHALALEQRALDQPVFASLQAADLMTVGATSIALAPQSRLEGIHQDVNTVVNLSGRTLPVSVSMVGIAGLTASVEPGILEPGETATIRLDGPVPSGSGTVTGTLNLYGFNQYVQIPIPVSVVLPDCGGSTTPMALGAEGAPRPQDEPVGCGGGLNPEGDAAAPAVDGQPGLSPESPQIDAALDGGIPHPPADSVTPPTDRAIDLVIEPSQAEAVVDLGTAPAQAEALVDVGETPLAPATAPASNT